MSFLDSEIGTVSGQGEVQDKVRAYIVDNLLLGVADDLDDGASLLDIGILDSTGAMELVAFIEHEFKVAVADYDLIPENLDSVHKICAFVARKLAAARA